MTDNVGKRSSDQEPPPIGRSWRNLYLFVLGFLLLEILLFTALTRWLQ